MRYVRMLQSCVLISRAVAAAGAVTAAGLGVAGTAATTSEADREGSMVYFVRWG